MSGRPAALCTTPASSNERLQVEPLLGEIQAHLPLLASPIVLEADRGYDPKHLCLFYLIASFICGCLTARCQDVRLQVYSYLPVIGGLSALLLGLKSAITASSTASRKLSWLGNRSLIACLSITGCKL